MNVNITTSGLSGINHLSANDVKLRLFSSGHVPTATPDLEARIRRRVKKLCKDATDLVWPELVTLLWPKTPEPEKPVVTGVAVVSSHGEKSRGNKGKIHSYVKRRKCVDFEPSVSADATWWKAFFADRWQAPQRASRKERLTYMAWWKNIFDDYWKMLERRAEQQRRNYAGWWESIFDAYWTNQRKQKVSQYTAWWVKALRKQEEENIIASTAASKSPSQVFAKSVAELISGGVASATRELVDMVKSTKKLDIKSPRRRSQRTIVIAETEKADAQWWLATLMSKDSDYVTFLLENGYEADAVLAFMREMLPSTSYRLWKRRKVNVERFGLTPRSSRRKVGGSAEAMANGVTYMKIKSKDKPDGKPTQPGKVKLELKRSSEVIKFKQAKASVKAARRFFPNSAPDQFRHHGMTSPRDFGEDSKARWAAIFAE